MARHLLVQISDLHLTRSGTLPPGVRPRDQLVAGLSLLAGSGLSPEAFLLTGDLADEADPACYEDLAALVGAAAAASGASVIYLPGNHDTREGVRRHLLGVEASGTPLNQTHEVNGLRIVSLDSVVPGEDGGALAPETLAFLEEALSEPAPDGTLLALHHPPVPSPIATMARIMLADPGALGRVVAGSDVRLVVAGHNHHGALGLLGDVPVWVSPSAAYLADLSSRDVFRRLPGSAFSRIELSEDGVLVTEFPLPAVLA